MKVGARALQLRTYFVFELVATAEFRKYNNFQDVLICPSRPKVLHMVSSHYGWLAIQVTG